MASVNRGLAAIGVVMMLVIGFLTVIDVVLFRNILNAPLPGTNEIWSTFFSVAIALVLASGLSTGATLEVDLMSGMFGRTWLARIRAWGAAAYTGVLAVIALAVIRQAMKAYGSHLATPIFELPLWPFYYLVAALVVLCVLTQVLNLVTMSLEIPDGLGPVDAGLAAAVGAIAVAGGLLAVAAASGWLMSHPVGVAAAAFGLLWVLVFLLVPLAAALGLVALLGIAGTFGFDGAVSIFGTETFGLFTSADLSILPLFLLMGGVALVAGLADDLYDFASAVFAPFRGGLSMATIAGCAGFGSLTGSSVAAVATVGSAAYPQMQSRGYAPEVAAGSIAAGGTLGQLVPPSTVIVLYALLVEESIGVLYVAIILPALLTAALYILAVALIALTRRGAVPAGTPIDPGAVGRSALRCIPAAVLFVMVIGGIFFGVFTANEAAAVGAVLTFLFALARGRLRAGAFWNVATETTRSTSMIYFVIIGAFAMTFFVASSGLPTYLTSLLVDSSLSPLAVLAILALTLIALGTVMDSITIMMITAATTLTVVQSLGYDPIWWGVVMVVIVEMGLITPPFGINLFVMKGVTDGLSLRTVYRGVMPFIAADIVKLALLILFPAAVMWLPSLM